MSKEFQNGNLVATPYVNGYHVIVELDCEDKYGRCYGHSATRIRMVLSQKLKKYTTETVVPTDSLRHIAKEDIMKRIDRNIAQLTKAKRDLMMMEQDN